MTMEKLTRALAENTVILTLNITRFNEVNIMVADALAPCVARPTAAMVLNM